MLFSYNKTVIPVTNITLANYEYRLEGCQITKQNIMLLLIVKSLIMITMAPLVAYITICKLSAHCSHAVAVTTNQCSVALSRVCLLIIASTAMIIKRFV